MDTRTGSKTFAKRFDRVATRFGALARRAQVLILGAMLTRTARMSVLVLAVLVFAAAVWALIRPIQRDDVMQSAAALSLMEMGRSAREDVARVVRPAIERTQKLAVDPAVIAALRAGDQQRRTLACNTAIRSATEIDAFALFDAGGRIVAINTVYASGDPIPQERVDRIMGSDFGARNVIQKCVQNESNDAALEFQTTCDITPAFFDSSGLSVAYSVPVRDPETGQKLGVASARLRFERVTDILRDRRSTDPSTSMAFVTDHGEYFSESIAERREVPLIPVSVVAAVVAPLVTGGSEFSFSRQGENFLGLFRLQDFKTLDGGGIQVLVAANERWLTREIRREHAWAAATLFGVSGCLLLLRALLHGAVALRKSEQLAIVRQNMAEEALAQSDRADRAEAASQAKSEFLANMSHEIRTPLNGVVGTLELLADSSLTEQQRRYIQIGKTSALSLTSVINDILDLSKIEAGKLELFSTEFHLRRTAQDVMAMLAVRGSEKCLELASFVDPSLPEWVVGDPDRLRQIIINLVNNAVKFTERGSVTLQVLPSPAGRNSVRFNVTDTGAGVPKDVLKRLFKAFSQADASTTRKFGGTGLGLAICKQLAELMGGQVGVESEVGRGSTFWFDAVLPPATGHLEGIAGTVPLDHPAVRVLVVDDHQVQREFISACLRSQRFQPDTAENGEIALRMLHDAAGIGRPYAAVILDYDMPYLDGVDVAAMMHSTPALAHIPVILSSSAIDLDPTRVRTAGFAAHLTKPIRQSALFDSVMTVVAPNLPNLKLAESQLAAAQPASKTRSKTRVLLVEDNEINQLIARAMLTKAGFDCTVAPNGKAGVTAVLKEQFDLVLMDCQMPEMDGFEATREIRRLEESGPLPAQRVARLPIIALTANALKGDRERCLAAGMDAYTSKPIDLSQLITTMDTLFSTPTEGRQAA